MCESIAPCSRGTKTNRVLALWRQIGKVYRRSKRCGAAGLRREPALVCVKSIQWRSTLITASAFFLVASFLSQYYVYDERLPDAVNAAIYLCKQGAVDISSVQVEYQVDNSISWSITFWLRSDPNPP